MCPSAVESPEHALLTCMEHAYVVACREALHDRMRTLLPPLGVPEIPGDELALRPLLASPESAVEEPEFIRAVFGIFNSVELVWLVEFVSDTAPTGVG